MKKLLLLSLITGLFFAGNRVYALPTNDKECPQTEPSGKIETDVFESEREQTPCKNPQTQYEDFLYAPTAKTGKEPYLEIGDYCAKIKTPSSTYEEFHAQATIPTIRPPTISRGLAFKAMVSNYRKKTKGMIKSNIDTSQKLQHGVSTEMILTSYGTIFEAILNETSQNKNISSFITKIKSHYTPRLNQLESEIKETERYVAPVIYELLLSDLHDLTEQFQQDLGLAIVQQLIPNALNNAAQHVESLGKSLKRKITIDLAEKVSENIKNTLMQLSQSIENIVQGLNGVHERLVVPINQGQLQDISEPIIDLVDTIKQSIFIPLHTATTTAYNSDSDAVPLYNALFTLTASTQAFIDRLIGMKLLEISPEPLVIMNEQLNAFEQTKEKNEKFFKNTLAKIDAAHKVFNFNDAYVLLEMLHMHARSAHERALWQKAQDAILADQLELLNTAFDNLPIEDWQQEYSSTVKRTLKRLFDFISNTSHAYTTKHFQELIASTSLSTRMQKAIKETKQFVSQAFAAIIRNAIIARAAYVDELLNTGCGYSEYMYTQLVEDLKKLYNMVEKLNNVLRTNNLLIDPSHFDCLLSHGKLAIFTDLEDSLNKRLHEKFHVQPKREKIPAKEWETVIE